MAQKRAGMGPLESNSLYQTYMFKKVFVQQNDCHRLPIHPTLLLIHSSLTLHAA